MHFTAPAENFEQKMKAGSVTQWSDRINTPNDPVTALRSVPGFHVALVIFRQTPKCNALLVWV